MRVTLDTLSSSLASIQNDNVVLATELASKIAQEKQLQQQELRTVLLDIVDIFDRLKIGLDALHKYTPVNSLFKHSQKKDVQFIEGFKEGQTMTLRRFEQFLQRHQVCAIDCVGKTFDPRMMSAVEIGRTDTLENGIVLEELRRGFLMADQVLRLAEVKVNKK